MEQIKQLEELFPEQNPSGALGCEPGFPQLPREMRKGCLYDNTAKSLLAPEESPLGSEQIEGRDLYTIHCLTAKQSIYGSLPRSLPVLVPQSCPTLCDPTDCRPPASSVCGILQARIQEWVAMPCSRGSSSPRDQTQLSSIAGRVFKAFLSYAQ